MCTGALVLGAAGLLNGLTATTHCGQLDALRGSGALPTAQRVVEHLDERIITAAGVSAGVDMALRLCELVAGNVAAQAIQLIIEYDPQPPHAYTPPGAAAAEMFECIMAYATPNSFGGTFPTEWWARGHTHYSVGNRPPDAEPGMGGFRGPMVADQNARGNRAASAISPFSSTG